MKPGLKRMRPDCRILVLGLSLLGATQALGQNAERTAIGDETRRYTFSWTWSGNGATVPSSLETWSLM